MPENGKPAIDILVADDEPHIARALNFIFKKEGYNVEMAFDGDAAMQIIKECRPKFVFLDLIMPKRMVMKSARP